MRLTERDEIEVERVEVGELRAVGVQVIRLRTPGAPVRQKDGTPPDDPTPYQGELGEAAVDLPVVTRGVALRYWNEIYVDPGALERVEGTGGLEDPRAWATRVEDYGLKRSNEDRQ